MPLPPGTRLDPYEIQTAIGAGAPSASVPPVDYVNVILNRFEILKPGSAADEGTTPTARMP